MYVCMHILYKIGQGSRMVQMFVKDGQVHLLYPFIHSFINKILPHILVVLGKHKKLSLKALQAASLE